MYVKISQDQLDEVQGLLDNKNEKINVLERVIEISKDTENYAMMKEQLKRANSALDDMKDNETKLHNELDDLEEKLELREQLYTEKIERIDNLYALTSDKITELQNKYNAVCIDLDIQYAVNKKAVQMLNELNLTGSNLKLADLSNILDVKA